MKRTVWTTVAAVAVVVAAYSQYTRPFPDIQSAPPGESVPRTDAGFVIHVDPQTGDLVADPAVVDAPVTIDDALNQSSEGLEQVPAPVGGGRMVDLQGRFQNTYVATVDDEGNLEAECLDTDADEAVSDADAEE